jgi:predicted SAM-dependent methyltransferase
LSNIEDGTFQFVIAKNILEHISWRKTVGTLREWLRVLTPGGVLEVESPSAWQLIPILVNPRDKHGTRMPHENDFEYFNRTLFGHQDYPENAHLSYFTVEWLRGFLSAEGVQEFFTLRDDERSFCLQAVKP